MAFTRIFCKNSIKSISTYGYHMRTSEASTYRFSFISKELSLKMGGYCNIKAFIAVSARIYMYQYNYYRFIIRVTCQFINTSLIIFNRIRFKNVWSLIFSIIHMNVASNSYIQEVKNSLFLAVLLWWLSHSLIASVIVFLLLELYYERYQIRGYDLFMAD